MSALITTDKIFYEDAGLDQDEVVKIVTEGLAGASGGELYLEKSASESFSWSDGGLKGNSYEVDQGFGMRYVTESGAFAYDFSNELTEARIQEAADAVKGIQDHHDPKPITTAKPKAPAAVPQNLYAAADPIAEYTTEEKIKLLEEVDKYARSLDSRIQQVTVNMSGSIQNVQIVKPDGERVADVRPLVRMDVVLVMKDGSEVAQGHVGWGGRQSYSDFFNDASWKDAVHEAKRIAEVNLKAEPAPAGQMPVVIGNGWGGVMLHEAVGHPLEGDFNRKGTSVFSGKIGQKVAGDEVTIVDQGDIADRRGSLNIDDEGNKTQKNVLIENGILKGYMQDATNARLMGVDPTGNGRRESYAHYPMPRMTTTFMEAGKHEPDDIIKTIKNGFYAAALGGGQVDIVSGEYVFQVSEGYLIEDGKITKPVKGATLIGNGPDTMTKIEMVGNDVELDRGIGTCGKDGQGVPVGVGQPTVKISSMTVGGTGGGPKP